MRVVVIGGTGHTGTYLVPRLIEADHEVAVISRQKSPRYEPDTLPSRSAWDRVQWVEMDRAKAEADGEFGTRVAELEPDVVIDMICYQPHSARQLVDALRGRIQLLVHCGTIWASGPAADLLRALSVAGFAPPSMGEAMRETGATEELVRALAARGGLVRVSDDVAFARGAYDAAVELVKQIIRETYGIGRKGPSGQALSALQSKGRDTS